MTLEELSKVPFHCVSHLAMEDESCTTYVSEDGRLGFCDHQPYKDGRPVRGAYRHYQIDGKVYKSKEKFLEAIKNFNPKIIPIRK